MPVMATASGRTRAGAARLGVSRPSTPRSVIALEVAGVVEVRTGSGIYFADVGPSGHARLRQFLAGDPGPGPYEALEVRRLLEGEAAFRAAAKLDAAQIDKLRRSVRRARRPGAVRGEAMPPIALFELIASASGTAASWR